MTALLTLLLVPAALAGAPKAGSSAPAGGGPDRSTPPHVPPSAVLDHPEPETFELVPGVTVHWIRVPGVRRVEIWVTQWGGTLALDGADTWTGALTGDLRDVATASWTARALSERREELDASVWSGSDLRYHTFGVDAPREALGPALELLTSIVAEPAYPLADLRRAVRDTRINLLARAPTDASTVASRLLDFALLPEHHPGGQPMQLDELETVRRAHLAARAPRLGTLGPVDVVVAGDVSADGWKEPLRDALGGLGVPGPRPDPFPAPPTRARVFAVDMPGIDQAHLRVAFPAPSWEHADFAAFCAIDFALGGAFLSRLNQVLREEEGLTYGVDAFWWRDDRYGGWQAELEVAEADVQVALELLLRELAVVATEGVTPDEIAAAAQSEALMWNNARETAASTVGLYDALVERGTTVAEERTRLGAIRKVQPEQTREAAARWFDPAGRVVVVVGERAVVEPQIRAVLGEPVWIDAKEAVLGTFDRGFAD